MSNNEVLSELIKGTGFEVSSVAEVLTQRGRVSTPLDVLNNILGGGIPFGTVLQSYGPPKCFTGDTKILSISGESKTLEELVKDNSGVYTYSCDTKSGKLDMSYSPEVILSHYTRDLVEVEIDGKYKIKCTPDHPFLLKSMEYKKAGDLEEFDELVPVKLFESKPDGYLGASTSRVFSDFIVTSSDSEFLVHQRLADKYLDKKEPPNSDKLIVHHRNGNKLDNRLENLDILSNSEHARHHYTSGDYDSFIEGGISTRFGQDFDKDSKRSKSLWSSNSRKYGDSKSLTYREYMMEVNKKINENPPIATSNLDKEFQIRARKGKVLSYLNRLLLEVDDVTFNNYEDCRTILDSKYNISKYGICSAFGILTESGDADYDELKIRWNSIIDLARSYNHKVTKITKIELETEVPVYSILDVEDYHNYAIDLGDGCSGVIVSNSGKSTWMYQTMGNFQREYPNGISVIIDTESSADGNRLSYLGVDTNRVLLLPSTSIEEGFLSLLQMIQNKEKVDSLKDAPVFVVWDTISKGLAQSDSTQSRMNAMDRARVIKNYMSPVMAEVSRHDVILCLLNQVIYSTDRYGNQKADSGGGVARHLWSL